MVFSGLVEGEGRNSVERTPPGSFHGASRDKPWGARSTEWREHQFDECVTGVWKLRPAFSAVGPGRRHGAAVGGLDAAMGRVRRKRRGLATFQVRGASGVAVFFSLTVWDAAAAGPESMISIRFPVAPPWGLATLGLGSGPVFRAYRPEAGETL